LCEAFRTLDGRFTVTALRPQGQSYLPLVEESFYKAWGPVAIALDAARIDPMYLLMMPIYFSLFRPHMSAEMARLRVIVRAFTRPARPF